MKGLNRLIGISLLCTCVTLLCYILQFYKNDISTNPNDWASFGNYIGGILGSILGFISILVVCWTFYKQDESQRIQQLDSSFFNLLSVQQKVIESIKGRIKLVGGGSTEEKNGFDYISQLAIIIQKRENKEAQIDNYKEKLIELYDISQENKNQLCHYFRYLYYILKCVDNSLVSESIKRKYVDIIQAQMSDDELYLCFLYSCTIYEQEQFRFFLDKYGILKYIAPHGEKFDQLKKEIFPQTFKSQN